MFLLQKVHFLTNCKWKLMQSKQKIFWLECIFESLLTMNGLQQEKRKRREYCTLFNYNKSDNDHDLVFNKRKAEVVRSFRIPSKRDYHGLEAWMGETPGICDVKV